MHTVVISRPPGHARPPSTRAGAHTGAGGLGRVHRPAHGASTPRARTLACAP
ncbi:hypothetical protein QJS66_21815 [Kocuria rhizophila]|nr:hypothetical protein QJS66_21815 [Kocuria rhizophila]